ncbi:glycoside hydrolase family 2 TIM barrel-domain containing protein [soil metagenome]
MFSLRLQDQKWTFRQRGKSEWHPANVPGCVHTDLQRNGLIPDPFWGDNEQCLRWIEECDWDYCCEFEVDDSVCAHRHLEMVFEGLDTLAIVRLNQKEIGRAENMFLGYRFDVARVLKPGVNTLEIRFLNPMDYIRARQRPDDLPEGNDIVGGSSHLRKQQCSFGWDWGPRFATCGVYLPARLEGWDDNRIASVRIDQMHTRGSVALSFVAESAKPAQAKYQGTVSFGGELVARIVNGKAIIRKPLLWWPNGYGEQPLYDVKLELLHRGNVVDTWERKFGLRTIELDRHPDAFGESFQFVVNGRPIFAKGANWIPAHSFVAQVDTPLYDNLLTSATDAHMNMIRVWGGGIYEKEEFYDLCDQKGLLVWQDFMFACYLFPGTREFLSLVRSEAVYQLKRLSYRTCLALWCGNNEIEQIHHEIVKTARRKKAYDSIFYDLLPKAVAARGGATAYWPSSAHNPDGYEKGNTNERAGDCHFWEVWFERKPVKRYEELSFRFCSEFGMQAYCSPEVAATFCRPEDFNVFGPEMENHQKCSAGNAIILEYVSRRFRFPKDYATLAYLSQLNQAYCIKTGVEHFRRSMPRTMGALYWQINDCWPVASWSSIEFGGQWKALHYEAKRFFAPALLSVHVLGDESTGPVNSLVSTIHDVDLYTVYDGVEPKDAVLTWQLCHFKDGRLRGGRKKVTLRYGESVKQLTLDFAREMRRWGARRLYLRVELESGGAVLSRQTVFLTAQRYLDLPAAPIRRTVRKIAPSRYEVDFISRVFQHAVAFHFRDTSYRAEDNFFDLFPGETRTINLHTERDLPAKALKSALELTSLRSSY